MNDLPTLLLPASLVEPRWADAARVAELAGLPGWSRLARRASILEEAGAEGPPPAEPGHERWLRRRFELPAECAVAAWSALPDGRPQADWRLDPVHLHLGRDHLVLTDPAMLALSADDARELADAVAPLFADEGLALDAGAGARWYLRELDPARALRLRTRSMLGALGRNIDAWMPVGDDARRWRRLLNEVQMTWHAHPANGRREARRLPPVNSLWIEGRGPAACPARTAAVAGFLARIATRRRSAAPGDPAPADHAAQPLHAHDDAHDGDHAGNRATAPARSGGDERGTRLAASARAPAVHPLEVDDAGGRLYYEDALLEAHVAGDPQRWADAWHALDGALFGPIARADGPWRAGACIVLAGDAGWRALRVGPRRDWRFWRRPAGAALLAEPAAAAGDGSVAR